MANSQKEYIEEGYIKLARKVFNSKTFSSLNAIQKLIAIYLILMANHKDKQWWDKYHNKFINIKRGSFITSIEQIRKRIKDRLVTTQRIRTCVKILKNMQFLTTEITSGYSHITIIKYDFYQDASRYKTKGLTSHQQASNKPLTTNNNGNNGKNGNKEEKIYMIRYQIIKYLNQKTGAHYKVNTPETIKHINARLKEGFILENFKYVIDVKCAEWKGKFNKEGKNMEDFMRPITLFGTKFEGYLNQAKPDPYQKYYKKEVD